MPAYVGVAAIVIVVLVVLAGFAFFRSLIEERARSAEARANQLEALLDEVKDVAWTNRELAPDFATIIIDTIRTSEDAAKRRQLP
jgi:uncharacterized membrane protein